MNPNRRAGGRPPNAAKPMDMGGTKSGIPKPSPKPANPPAKGSAALKSAAKSGKRK